MSHVSLFALTANWLFKSNLLEDIEMGEENNCKRYTEGKCATSDVCAGKDCGVYEPNCANLSNSSIPKKCRSCAMFSGAYCEVHQHLIEDAANCSEWTPIEKVRTKGLRNFDCHYHNGYTGCCNLKGGDCTRKCKDFKTDDEYYDGLSESDLHISVAKLREVLEEMADGFDEPIIYNTKVEDIIERVKREV